LLVKVILKKATSLQSYDAKCLFVSADFRYLVIFLTTGFCCAFEQMLVSLRFFDKYYCMKIITTAVLLLITLLVVPLFSYFFGTAPGPAEWAALRILFIIAAGVAGDLFAVGQTPINQHPCCMI